MMRRKLPVWFLIALFLGCVWPLSAASTDFVHQTQLMAAKGMDGAMPKAQRKPQSRTQNSKGKAAENGFELLKSPGQDRPKPFRKTESVLGDR